MNLQNKGDLELSYIVQFTNELYEKGFSAMDIVKLLEDDTFLSIPRFEILINFSQMKKEIRNEKMLLLFLMKSIFFTPLP